MQNNLLAKLTYMAIVLVRIGSIYHDHKFSAFAHELTELISSKLNVHMRLRLISLQVFDHWGQSFGDDHQKLRQSILKGTWMCSPMLMVVLEEQSLDLKGQ